MLNDYLNDFRQGQDSLGMISRYGTAKIENRRGNPSSCVGEAVEVG